MWEEGPCSAQQIMLFVLSLCNYSQHQQGQHFLFFFELSCECAQSNISTIKAYEENKPMINPVAQTKWGVLNRATGGVTRWKENTTCKSVLLVNGN